MELQVLKNREEPEIFMDREWDLIIIGGGPAGLTAGIYAARMGLKTLILEKNVPGGRISLNPWIENYPGFLGISGEELASRFVEQAKMAGAVIFSPVEARKIVLDGSKKKIVTNKGIFVTKAVIIASGGRERILNVSGEEELKGRGVSYHAIRDGPLFRDKRVAIVGGGDAAVTSAIYLSNLAKEVYLIHRRDKLRAEKALIEKLFQTNVKVIWNTVIKAIKGNKSVKKLILRNKLTGEEKALTVDGVFICIGYVPNSEIAKEAGVKIDEKGYIITNKKQETNIPGVYAAGDVTGKPEQIAKAIGEGAVAALSAYRYITSKS